MTTIATDGISMAADSQCGGETFHCEVRKIVSAADGALLGCCGHAFDVGAFVDWYEGGMVGAPNVTDDFEGLILTGNGAITCVDEKGRRFRHSAPAAIGSGCRFAYGAMDAGKGPLEAVQIAIRRDAYSGGECYEERIARPVMHVAV